MKNQVIQLGLISALTLGLLGSAFAQSEDIVFETVKEVKVHGAAYTVLKSKLERRTRSVVRDLQADGHEVTQVKIFERCEASYGLLDTAGDDEYTCFAEVSYLKN